ncbi:vegetative cell wall protein gp1-like [Hibiscus syriacus]|uniref:vegetative cell wall protein gp1-like n=1 Tax=Hibiscus syriacus TaxID=106335 RepID=UPI001923BE1A|nr:vegetative cell wall protein gp1-like [Hibiscus syriacus]
MVASAGGCGYNASPSPAEFSSFSPTEGIPGAVKQRSFAPSMPPQSNDLHSPPALPPLMPVSVPETTEGDAHSSSPINSMEPTPQNTAPPPFPIEENLPLLAPRIPVVLPPSPPSVRAQNTAPPPFPIEEHLPLLAPSIPVVLPPSPQSARTQNTAPPPFPIEENLPTLAPSFPVVLAPSPPSAITRNTAPPSFPIEEHLPSFAQERNWRSVMCSLPDKAKHRSVHDLRRRVLNIPGTCVRYGVVALLLFMLPVLPTDLPVNPL